MADQKEHHQKEAFVGAQDRPEVTLNPDTPIAELRVRDLTALLGTARKLGDKIAEKSLVAEHKVIVADTVPKPGKEAFKDIIEVKHFRDSLHKEFKDINDTVVAGGTFIPGPDPGPLHAIDALVKEVAKLREEVNALKR
jgi:hypothetical protein